MKYIIALILLVSGCSADVNSIDADQKEVERVNNLYKAELAVGLATCKEAGLQGQVKFAWGNMNHPYLVGCIPNGYNGNNE